MNPDCLFCKIIEGKIPSHKIAETDEFLSFLDINPVNLGHTLVVPKAHYENLFELPEEAAGNLMKEVQRIAKGVKEGTKADGINIIMNNLRASGQLVDHSHTHVIPRYHEDGLKHWPHKQVSTEELASTAKHLSTLF